LTLVPALLALSFPTFAKAGPASPPIKVACVGDSITWGMAWEKPDPESWPARLQTLLGDGYEVRNFGVIATTLQKCSDFSYWEQQALRDSLVFQPDVVFILLGANDTKPVYWRDKESFLADYRALIAEYAALPSAPTVFPMPPTVLKAGRSEAVNGSMYDMNSDLHAQIVQAIRELASADGLPLIDLYDVTVDHEDELYPDGVHMTPQSWARIAVAAREAIAAWCNRSI